MKLIQVGSKEREEEGRSEILATKFTPEASTISVMDGTDGTGMSSNVAFNLLPEDDT